MATKSTPLTATSKIGTWLQDLEGGPLIRNLLERGGFDGEQARSRTRPASAAVGRAEPRPAAPERA
jgi:hypothetical protein